MSLRYQLVDVFIRENPTALSGNPLAVFELNEASPAIYQQREMQQRIANWLNLSETTFATISAARDYYALKIYTPQQELPFAGHPSIGSYAALIAQLQPGTRHAQHCAAGELPLRYEEKAGLAPIYWVQTPRAELVAMNSFQTNLLTALSVERAITPAFNVNNGPTWTVVQLASADQVLKLKPDLAAVKALNLAMRSTGLAVFAWGRDELGDYIETRCFVPLDNIEEDPVTGSANAAIAAYLHHLQTGPEAFRARQGRGIGRDGELFLDIKSHPSGAAIWLGGRAKLIAQGQFK